jgi:hypothetical protein
MMDWQTIGNLGANLLTGAGIFSEPELPWTPSPLNIAVNKLRERGHSVSPADGVPGLFDVSGVGELTIGQVIDLANR